MLINLVVRLNSPISCKLHDYSPSCCRCCSSLRAGEWHCWNIGWWALLEPGCDGGHDSRDRNECLLHRAWLAWPRSFQDWQDGHHLPTLHTISPLRVTDDDTYFTARGNTKLPNPATSVQDYCTPNHLSTFSLKNRCSIIASLSVPSEPDCYKQRNTSIYIHTHSLCIRRNVFSVGNIFAICQLGGNWFIHVLCPW